MEMRQPKYTTKFKKDIKRQKKRGKTSDLITHIMTEICNNGDAPQVCRPHNLSGNWNGYRECHIEPDWLLIYTVEEEAVTFYRTGTHSDLFSK